MNKLLILQIIISFLAGGGFIALLTLIAERVSEKISGIILMLPSTVALGFFFLGWTTSPEKVAKTVPATLIPLGIAVLSSVIYVYTSGIIQKRVHSKWKQVISTAYISTIAWLILATPFAFIRFSSLKFGIVGYLILIILSHFLLQKDHKEPRAEKPDYSLAQKIYRAAFMGTIIALVVFLGKTLNTFWGGIFTMFPAAVFSALIFFHFHYPQKELIRFIKKIPTGSISLFIYALSTMILFPKIGFIWGTLGAYFFSLISSLILIRLSNK